MLNGWPEVSSTVLKKLVVCYICWNLKRRLNFHQFLFNKFNLFQFQILWEKRVKGRTRARKMRARSVFLSLIVFRAFACSGSLDRTRRAARGATAAAWPSSVTICSPTLHKDSRCRFPVQVNLRKLR